MAATPVAAAAVVTAPSPIPAAFVVVAVGTVPTEAAEVEIEAVPTEAAAAIPAPEASAAATASTHSVEPSVAVVAQQLPQPHAQRELCDHCECAARYTAPPALQAPR